FSIAELSSFLDKLFAIKDYIAVGQHGEGDLDEQVLLFVKMKHGRKLNEYLHQDIRSAIKFGLSSRHVPAHIFQVEDLPYTLNGKKIKNLPREVVSGKEGTATEMAANPECLAGYRKFLDLPSGSPASKL
ncbi:hypothetical protein K469DRAFT_573352, partial [Zopfia rhizophila CBS 207.26]